MRPSRPNNRLAYTLMELMLVVALIVMIAAIAIPVMQAMLADSRITAAADRMRGRMAEARARAMDEGRPWKFAFTPNARLYQLAPEDSPEWTGNSRDLVEKSDVIRDELPVEVYFGLTHEDIMNGTEPPTPGSGWHIAAVYLPDGSARDDSTVYFGKMGVAPMRTRLRALTGVVSVDEYKAAREAVP